MKKNIKILILSIVLVVAMVGCSPADKNMRNLSTQTRLGNNVNDRFMNDNLTLNKRDGVGNNLNNGMTRNNNMMNNTRTNNDNLNNGMLNNGTNRDNTMMNDGIIRNGRLNDGMMNDTMIGNNTNMTTNMTGLSQRASTIAKRVNALEGVNNASVLIDGDTAIVGCDVGKTMDNKTTANLKQRVEAAVKVADKNIKKVSVTLDPNIYSRIKTMSTDMMNGNPAKSFTQDIKDIMRDITNVR